ncbi:DUF6634 family protein [Mesorhizobium sp. 1B3]|uniref:DUF6634 family protein n=1 Tax=Mesorhizobium sp. 1B3 TaxID=3243599 RepID=UPI003D99C9D3
MLKFEFETSERLRSALKFEAGRFSTLAADLAELADRKVLEWPGPIFPENAPILDFWSVGVRPAACLIGRAAGHPILCGQDREIITSDLVVISEELGWARTRSRWYRLGQKAPSQSSSH